MAENALAKSVFVTTPDEKTVVADVYKVNDATPVNSYQDIALTGFEVKDEFGFLNNVVSEKLLHDAAGDVSIDKESLVDKISGAFSAEYGKAKSMVGGLLSGSKAAIKEIKSNTNAVTGMLKQARDVQATVMGVVQTVKTGNLKNLRGVADTINAISGKVQMSLSTNGALGGIFTSVVGEAGNAGIKDAFGVVAASIKDASNITDKGKLIYQVASGSLPAAVKRGDLRSITSMVDNIGSNAVNIMQPNILNVLSKTNKDKYTPAQIAGTGTNSSQFVEYQGAYQKIDPNWNVSKWNPIGNSAPMKDLKCLMGASQEVKDVFALGAKMSSDPSVKYLTALSKVKTTSVDEMLNKRFPGTPAATTQNLFTPDMDARLAAMKIE